MPSGMGGAPGGVTNPHCPSWAPPTGALGRGSGAGTVWSGFGTSDASTAGGGVLAYGQESVSGVICGGAGCQAIGDAAAGTVVPSTRMINEPSAKISATIREWFVTLPR